ncbi:hypothetical protein QAD02_004344 [Eretmocerus hayati]|uniref:Uncharacterized protein n=1 Tax=Eretmocerus hayati TaxID=131215 RepID=A0ACC2NQH9_9HYME|nr:hypothetical protein QAD02_004344 [Eretmocerus hayati]
MATTPAPLDSIEGKSTNASEKCVEKLLDLSDLGITRVNRSLISDRISGTCLKSLLLQGNRIQEFEEGIFSNFTDLEYLDLARNDLTEATLFSFGSVPSLKTLILDWNQRKGEQFTLDKKVYFPEVTHLSLQAINGSSPVAINWSEYFPKIEELDVSGNRLAPLDDFFNNIPSTLRSLTMKDVGLEKLRIQNLKNVTSLELDGNNFRSIKGSSCDEDSLCLENLDGLESLSLRLCNIKLIEEHAFEHLTKLSYLDISFNEITRISSGTFGHSPALSYLDISDDLLVNVSFISELKNLTTLRMDHVWDRRAFTESLFSVSSVPTKIQILSLKFNGISSIPPRFLDNLQDLREIDLSFNRISSLSPGSWQRNLKVINLNNNNVSKIEDLHLSEARSLELLDLRGNELVSSDPEVIKALPEKVE